jgi:hypothetical protein
MICSMVSFPVESKMQERELGDKKDTSTHDGHTFNVQIANARHSRLLILPDKPFSQKSEESFVHCSFPDRKPLSRLLNFTAVTCRFSTCSTCT